MYFWVYIHLLVWGGLQLIEDKTGVFNSTVNRSLYCLQIHSVALYFNCSMFNIFLDQSPLFFQKDIHSLSHSSGRFDPDTIGKSFWDSSIALDLLG